MDNYYLNNAVYLVEEFLKSTTNPFYGARWITVTGPSIAGTAIIACRTIFRG